jgi:hypothetical protein
MVLAERLAAGYGDEDLFVRSHGEPGVTARLLPFTVDGLIWAASMVVLDASLWVPEILSPYAACEYSWIRPPSRSRRRPRRFAPGAGGLRRPAGGLWCRARCGR